MTFKKLDSDRLYFIVTNSVPPELLLDFYRRNDKRLILQGVKISSLPKNTKTAVKIFITLPDKAIPIAREWFSRKFENEPKVDFSKIINKFLAYESVDDKNTDSDEIQNFSRNIFLDLLSENPNQSVVEFMSSKIKLGAESTILNPTSIDLISSTSEETMERLISKITPYLDTFKTDKLSDLTDSELFAVMAISSGEAFRLLTNEFHTRVGKSNLTSDNHEALLNALGAKNNYSDAIPSIKLIDSKFTSDLSSIDPKEVKFLGVIKNIVESSNTRFIRVLAVISGENCYGLNETQRKELLPDSGDVIWLGRGQKKVLGLNQFGIFTVKPEENSSKRGSNDTHFFLDELIQQVYPVVFLEASVKENTKIKNLMEAQAEHIASKHAYVLIGNEGVLKPHMSTNSIDFNEPMELFHQASLFNIDNQLFTYQLGISDKKIDFSSSESYLKKLLKSDLLNKNNILKDQAQNLIDELRLINSGDNSEKVADLILNLNNLLDKKEFVDEIALLLEGNAEIQRAVQERIDILVSEKIASENIIRSEIIELENKKNALKSSLLKEEANFKKLRQKFSQDIKGVFEKAKEDGGKVLSEAAFFMAIMESNGFNKVESQHQTIVSSDTLARSYTINSRMPSTISLNERFANLPFPERKVARLFEAIMDSVELGFVPAFKGRAATILSGAIVDHFPSSIISEYEIYPGVIQIPELKRQNLDASQDQIILLNNFDMSPISLYGQHLIDEIFVNFMSRSKKIYPLIVLTFESTGLGLDYPLALETSMVIIDTDQIEFDDIKVDLDDFRDLINDDESLDAVTKKSFNYAIKNLEDFQNSHGDERLYSLYGFLTATYFDRLMK